MKQYSIAIHGGAGAITRSQMSSVMEEEYKHELFIALEQGEKILKNGGSALDAVSMAVIALENCPLFNAGKGAVFNHEGKHEMDASIMCGKNRNVGAVAGVSNIKNPIVLARTVMEHSEHVMLMGEGAELFARQNNIVFEKDDYFFDQFRFEQLQEALKHDRVQLDHFTTKGDGKKFGTVGAVAKDIHGNLAAATSTGGMTNKKFGRVGDTPIIGAGTYASNATCAVSCTGHGELFIRQVVAHQVHAMMLYGKLGLQEACNQVIHKDLVEINGEGGLIAIDHSGEIYLPFNSEGMYRAYVTVSGEKKALIY